MKKIRVHISKIKNHFYAKIPDLLVEKMNLSNGHDLEITIHPTENLDQVEMWSQHPEDINAIEFYINDEVHTMNMYNRIYIPEKYRFFIPHKDKDFILFLTALKVVLVDSNQPELPSDFLNGKSIPLNKFSAL